MAEAAFPRAPRDSLDASSSNCRVVGTSIDPSISTDDHIMATDWQRVVRAVACRVEFEFACGRGKLVDEAGVKLYVAEALQAISGREVDVELNHPDLPGNKRLDVVVKRPQSATLDAAVELKWVRQSGNSNRHWAEEIGQDVLRLERINADCDSSTERVAVVVGIRDEVASKLKNRTKNAGNGNARIRIFTNFLQGHSNNAVPTQGVLVRVRDCEPVMRAFFKIAAEGFETSAPVSYRVQLIAHHSAGGDGASAEAYVWRIWRVQNRQVFDMTTQAGW